MTPPSRPSFMLDMRSAGVSLRLMVRLAERPGLNWRFWCRWEKLGRAASPRPNCFLTARKKMTSVEYLPQYRKPYSTDYHTTEAPLNGRKAKVYAQARPRLGDGSSWRPLLATGRRTPPKPVLLRFDMQPPRWGYYRYCIVRTSMPVPSAPTESGWTGLRLGGGPYGICCKGTVKGSPGPLFGPSGHSRLHGSRVVQVG
jgi:hypothetical protein